jgi:hypothetical protein
MKQPFDALMPDLLRFDGTELDYDDDAAVEPIAALMFGGVDLVLLMNDDLGATKKSENSLNLTPKFSFHVCPLRVMKFLKSLAMARMMDFCSCALTRGRKETTLSIFNFLLFSCQAFLLQIFEMQYLGSSCNILALLAIVWE